MSAFSQFAIQKAVVAVLAGDVTLMALVSGVYDYISQDVAFPYVSLGEGTCRDRSTKTTTGADVTFVLHVYSREGGHKETLLIMERLHSVLHQADLALSGHTLVSLRFDSSIVGRMDDGLTHHGVMRFRAITEATA